MTRPHDPTYGKEDAPATYDHGQTMSIVPDAIWDLTYFVPDEFLNVSGQTMIVSERRGAVPDLMRQIEDSFTKISDTWDSLKLSWVGEGADAAQQVNTMLQEVQNRLWGMKVADEDVPGVIGQMCGLAAGAALNYSNVEESNTKMFQALLDAVAESAPSEGGESSPPDRSDFRDVTDPPVFVTYSGD